MGRPKGALNHATKDLKALAGQYTVKALETLASIMANPKAPHAARVAAAREILDRSHGKAPQAITGEGGKGPVSVKVVHEYS